MREKRPEKNFGGKQTNNVLYSVSEHEEREAHETTALVEGRAMGGETTKNHGGEGGERLVEKYIDRAKDKRRYGKERFCSVQAHAKLSTTCTWTRN